MLARIEDGVFLDAVALVELELGIEFVIGVARREHFKNDLRSQPALAVLDVTAPVAGGPTEDDHRIRRRVDAGLPFDRIPKQIPGDQDILPGELLAQFLHDQHHPLPLQRVVGHGFPITFGVDHVEIGQSRTAHRRLPVTPTNFGHCSTVPP